MTAVLEPELISVEDYLAGEESSDVRHEYLGGMVHAMAGGSNRHNTISGNAFLSLGSKLTGKRCKPFNPDTKVRLKIAGSTRFYYPDLQVVCDQNPASDYFQDRPVVLMEVLSPSTRRTDDTEKKDAYLTIPSLAVYLLVDSEKVDVTAYRRSGDGFKMEAYRNTADVIALPEIDAELPLAELYAGVDFA